MYYTILYYTMLYFVIVSTKLRGTNFRSVCIGVWARGQRCKSPDPYPMICRHPERERDQFLLLRSSPSPDLQHLMLVLLGPYRMRG